MTRTATITFSVEDGSELIDVQINYDGDGSDFDIPAHFAAMHAMELLTKEALIVGSVQHFDTKGKLLNGHEGPVQ